MKFKFSAEKLEIRHMNIFDIRSLVFWSFYYFAFMMASQSVCLYNTFGLTRHRSYIKGAICKKSRFDELGMRLRNELFLQIAPLTHQILSVQHERLGQCHTVTTVKVSVCWNTGYSCDISAHFAPKEILELHCNIWKMKPLAQTDTNTQSFPESSQDCLWARGNTAESAYYLTSEECRDTDITLIMAPTTSQTHT